MTNLTLPRRDVLAAGLASGAGGDAAGRRRQRADRRHAAQPHAGADQERRARRALGRLRAVESVLRSGPITRTGRTSSASRWRITAPSPTRCTCGWRRAIEYTPDFKQLTIKTRQGIKWSDGTPFSAEDVAYTFNTLRDLGPKVKWGVDVNQALDEATVTDPNTVVLKFKIPSPRFFFFADLQIRHRHLHGAEAHLPGTGLDQLQAFRPGERLAGNDGAVEGSGGLAGAEGVCAPR